jgi:hypothetical protein
MLLSITLAIYVTPLSARLFAEQRIIREALTPMVLGTEFNESAVDASYDWKPIFDAVSATEIYQGNPIPWTDGNHAYQSFSVVGSSTTTSTSGVTSNMTANVTAYRAHMDCKVLTNVKLELLRNLRTGAEVSMTASDRECDIRHKFTSQATPPVIFETVLQANCSAAAYYSRLFFVAGTYSKKAPNFLSNVHVISCITGYSATNGSLTVSSGLTQAPLIVSFTNTTPLEYRNPDLSSQWRLMEGFMLGPQSFNTGAKWSTTEFGSLILYHASVPDSNTNVILNIDKILSSIVAIFTAVYRNMVATNALKPVYPPQRVTGTVSTVQNRLFVVQFVAYSFLTILTCSLACCVWLRMTVRRHPSMLSEEPGCILSDFGILHGNNGGLDRMGQDVCQAPEYNGEFVRLARERWTLEKAVCDVEEVGGARRIRVRCLSPRQKALGRGGFGPERVGTARRAAAATW